MLPARIAISCVKREILITGFLVLNLVGFPTGNTSAQGAVKKIIPRKPKPTVGAVISAINWVFEADFHDGWGESYSAWRALSERVPHIPEDTSQPL